MGRQPVRQEIHTDDIKIDQLPPLSGDGSDRAPEIIVADKPLNTAYLDELAFNEEPVTIRIEPSAEKNAARHIPVWVQGKGCEVWNDQINGWVEAPSGYIPVGQVLTIKRKYLEVLARAKSTQVTTRHDDVGAEYIDNRVERITSAVCALSVLEDKNPRGAAWLTELRRRNF